MSLTVTIMELRKFTQKEITKLKKMTYADIWWQIGKIFCFGVEDAETNLYKETLPYCTKIVTSDGKEAYVSKCQYHSSSSDKLLSMSISSMLEEKVDDRYVNITKKLCGQLIDSSITVNDNSEKGYHIRQLNFAIPKVKRNGGLFFREC